MYHCFAENCFEALFLSEYEAAVYVVIGQPAMPEGALGGSHIGGESKSGRRWALHKPAAKLGSTDGRTGCQKRILESRVPFPSHGLALASN